MGDIAEELQCLGLMSRIEKSQKSGLEHFQQCEESEAIHLGVKAAVMSESEEGRSAKYTTETTSMISFTGK